jgi:hypothetical protein
MSDDRTPEDDGNFAKGCLIGSLLGTAFWTIFGIATWWWMQ